MARIETKSPSHSTGKRSTEKSKAPKRADTKKPQQHATATDIRKRKTRDEEEEHSSPSNKKRALKQSRQAFRPHADIVISAKDLWNKLRMHSNTPDQVASLMKNLMTLLQGKFAQVASKHDASRIVQAALQHANQNQRTLIVQELCASTNNDIDGSKRSKGTSHLVELSSSQYAHFIVLKMIKVCAHEPENYKAIVKALQGHIYKLAFHSVGARVVELLFVTFPPKATAILKLEFYGTLLARFHTGEVSSGTVPYTQVTLSSILKEESESSKQTVYKSFYDRIVVKGIEKKLYTFAFFQQLLCEYVTYAPCKTDIRQLASLISDSSLHLLSTKAGARVVSECAAYGSPKERKRIIKSLKGYVRSSLLHSDAYIAILRIMDVTDDTVMVQKSILAEIVAPPKSSLEKKKQTIASAAAKDEDNNVDEEDDPVTQEETIQGQDGVNNESPLLELALSDTGSKVFLLVLAKTDLERKKYFDPMNLEILHSNPTVMEDGHEVSTSKKNHEIRRSELLEYLKPFLIQLCQTHAGELLQSKFGSRVIRAVYETWPSEHLAGSIVAACNENSDNSGVSSLFEHPFAHLVIKNLLIFESDTADVKEGNHFLGSALYQRYKGRLRESISSSNRGAFVLATLASYQSTVGRDVRKELTKNEKELLALIREKTEAPTSTAGYEALIKALKN